MGHDGHDGWPMMGMMDGECSHTYEDGPHEAHDGWGWDGMGKWRSAFTGDIWIGMGMGMGCIGSIFALCGIININ